MDFKLVVIIVTILLVAISMQTELSDQHRHCEQFSGESNIKSASKLFLACEKESICQTKRITNANQKSIHTDFFTFHCVHIKEETLPFR